MGDKEARRWAVVAFLAVTLLPRSAEAHAPMGVAGLGKAVALVIGIGALSLSIVLGALSWATVLKPPKSAGWVFGRGFLGISAVIAFAVGGLGLAMGLELWLGPTSGVALGIVATLVMAFMATEFVIAGVLYLRSNAQPVLKKILAIGSFAFGVVFGLGALVIVVAGLIDLATPGPKLSVEVRGYQKGCADGDGSDCNMLGLRYRAGEGGLPRDPAKAAEAFQRSCDLGTPIGCRNLAGMYRKGQGVPKSEARAAELDERREALEDGS
jgi:hypothetical protein